MKRMLAQLESSWEPKKLSSSQLNQILAFEVAVFQSQDIFGTNNPLHPEGSMRLYQPRSSFISQSTKSGPDAPSNQSQSSSHLSKSSNPYVNGFRNNYQGYNNSLCFSFGIPGHCSIELNYPNALSKYENAYLKKMIFRKAVKEVQAHLDPTLVQQVYLPLEIPRSYLVFCWSKQP